MSVFLVIFAAALIVSAIGFKKYIWFISIGYGFAIAAIGIVLLCWRGSGMDACVAVLCALFVLYGCRLGGYLTYREVRMTSYNKKMQGEIKDGKSISMAAKIAIWVSAALLYACQTAPVAFRIENGAGSDGWAVAGAVIMAAGLALETAADLQKSAAKKVNPGRFVDTGLYRIVRCPNYFGEMTFWTGALISGITSTSGAWQWTAVLFGYIGIIYVMFSGARRLEMRQNRTYGDDPEYQKYVKTVPIMIPLIPIYSVEKYKWLVA